MTEPMPFGPTLAALRAEKGLTQQQLAAVARVCHTYLSKIENGKLQPPRQATLRRLADALNVSADWLILRAGKIPHARMAEAVKGLLEQTTDPAIAALPCCIDALKAAIAVECPARHTADPNHCCRDTCGGAYLWHAAVRSALRKAGTQ